MYHLETIDENTAKIVSVAFPSYRGRKVKLHVTDTIDVRSSWAGGSRDYFVFVRLDNYGVFRVPQQSAFDVKIQGADAAGIPNGAVCVEHTIFCGKDHGITIHANKDTLAPLLPPPTDTLPWEQLVVLYATSSLKSSYGGVKNVREHEAVRSTSITSSQYREAKLALIVTGHLNKAGAITAKGRNVCGVSWSWPKP